MYYTFACFLEIECISFWSWVLEHAGTFVLIKYSISFHLNQDEHTVKYSPHCFPHISYLGTDEENLVNIKDLFFLLIMFCYS